MTAFGRLSAGEPRTDRVSQSNARRHHQPVRTHVLRPSRRGRSADAAGSDQCGAAGRSGEGGASPSRHLLPTVVQALRRCSATFDLLLYGAVAIAVRRRFGRYGVRRGPAVLGSLGSSGHPVNAHPSLDGRAVLTSNPGLVRDRRCSTIDGPGVRLAVVPRNVTSEAFGPANCRPREPGKTA